MIFVLSSFTFLTKLIKVSLPLKEALCCGEGRSGTWQTMNYTVFFRLLPLAFLFLPLADTICLELPTAIVHFKVFPSVVIQDGLDSFYGYTATI